MTSPARRTTQLPEALARPSSPTPGSTRARLRGDRRARSTRTCPAADDDVDQRGDDPGRGPRRGRLRAPASPASSPGWASPRWSSTTSWATTSSHRPGRPTAPGSRAGDVVMRVAGPDPRPAHRRAHRAQLRLPPVRRRHRHRRLGRRPRGHRRPGARHPQDAARAAAPCRSTPCAAAAASTTGSASRDLAMVKDNHVVAAGRRGAGATRRCGRRTPACGSRSR